MGWRPGDVIVRRDVWRGQPWVGIAAIVVQDHADLLALYVPEGAEIAVADGEFPIVHPWSSRDSWEGHGIIVLHRPGDPYTVCVFWEGADRDFALWYLNLEAPFVRTELGVDMRDHVIDLWSRDGRNWHWKDVEEIDQRVGEGLFTADEASAIKVEADRLYAEVSGGGGWWDDNWSGWAPPAGWKPPRLPAGWALGPK